LEGGKKKQPTVGKKGEKGPLPNAGGRGLNDGFITLEDVNGGEPKREGAET